MRVRAYIQRTMRYMCCTCVELQLLPNSIVLIWVRLLYFKPELRFGKTWGHPGSASTRSNPFFVAQSFSWCSNRSEFSVERFTNSYPIFFSTNILWSCSSYSWTAWELLGSRCFAFLGIQFVNILAFRKLIIITLLLSFVTSPLFCLSYYFP